MVKLKNKITSFTSKYPGQTGTLLMRFKYIYEVIFVLYSLNQIQTGTLSYLLNTARSISSLQTYCILVNMGIYLSWILDKIFFILRVYRHWEWVYYFWRFPCFYDRATFRSISKIDSLTKSFFFKLTDYCEMR